MHHIDFPATTADQWAQRLAAPTRHWRTGCSARAGANLASIAVECKVAEPFGAKLEDWLAGASPGKQAYLAK